MSNLLETTVAALVREHAQAQPDKTALVVEEREFTYSELWSAAASCSRTLAERAVNGGDRVLLQASHSFAYVAAYLGITALGAVAVPFEYDLPDAAVASLGERVGASCLVADHSIQGFSRLISVDELLQIIENAGGLSTVRPVAASDGLAELLLTTGTTGRSKVVMLSHRAVMSVITNIIEATHIQSDNVSLVPMPLNHVFGLRRLQTGLVMGATVVLMNGVVSLKRFIGALNACHVTSLSLVPSALAFIEQTTKDYLGRYAGQIRFVESSSAPLPSSTRAWLRSVLPNSRLYNSYGCTESTACCMVEYSHRADDVACVGTPCATATIDILDTVTGLPARGVGRVAIGGSGVMDGYWGDEEATAQTLHDGMVYTNDLGCMQDGELFVQGRIDDVAIIGGNNVSPVEVEDEVAQSPVVADCACVKASDDVSGDRLVMFVVWTSLEADEEALRSELMTYMRGHLEAYKIPSEIRSLRDIPRTYNGKTDRKALARLLNEGE